MATITEPRHAGLSTTATPIPLRSGEAVRQAYQILHLGFTVAPIAFGVDKFFGLLVNWDQYLAPDRKSVV